MRVLRGILIAFCLAALSAVLILCVRVNATPMVSLALLGLSTNRWSAGMAAQLGRADYLCATMVLKNRSARPVTYLARYKQRFVEYELLQQTVAGWTKPVRPRGPTADVQSYTLGPGQSIRFRAVVLNPGACQVAVGYWTPAAKPLWPWLEWFIPAPNEGSEWRSVASRALGILREAPPAPHGRGPIHRLPVWALTFRAAAETGDADAQFKLAGMYYAGNGVGRDLKEALRWYESAAGQGQTEAAYNLGTIYEYGLGVGSNGAQAARWYHKAGRH